MCRQLRQPGILHLAAALGVGERVALAIDGIDPRRHLKQPTPFERVILGQPEDMAQPFRLGFGGILQRLGRNVIGKQLNTRRHVSRFLLQALLQHRRGLRGQLRSGLQRFVSILGIGAARQQNRGKRKKRASEQSHSASICAEISARGYKIKGRIAGRPARDAAAHSLQ